MGVKQEYPQLGACPHRLLQDVGYPSGFANAGGAEHRKMLSEHLIDFDAGVNFAVLLKLADADCGRAPASENDAQLVLGQ